MRNQFFVIAVLTIILGASCSSTLFTATDIEEKTADHKMVAILPFDVEMKGRLPEGMSEKQVEEVLESESEMFQRSLSNQILGSSSRGRGNFVVSFQSVDKTRAILSENGFDHKSLKDKDPQELAKLLGVDAVFKVKLRKQRYLSNVESWGVSQGVRVLKQSTDLPVFIPASISKTNDIDIDGSLIAADNGEVLFSFADRCAANYNRQPERIVELVNRSIARRFPYRQK